MRYLPLTPDDRTAMLAAIGAKSIDDLFVDVPQAARLDGPVDLPRVAGELEVERALSAMAAKNATAGAVLRGLTGEDPEGWQLPRAPTVVIDRDYVLAAVGLLASPLPGAARALARSLSAWRPDRA